MLPPGSRHPAQSFPRCHSERSEESRSCSGASFWRQRAGRRPSHFFFCHFLRKQEGGFTFEVQHMVSKNLGGRLIAETFPRRIIVYLNQMRKVFIGESHQVGLAGQGPAQAADGVFDAPLLPGRVGLTEEGLEAERMEGIMPCKLRPVIEGDRLAPRGRQGREEGGDGVGDRRGGFAGGARGNQQAGVAFMQGQDGLAVDPEQHQIGLPVPGGAAIRDGVRPLGQRAAQGDEGGRAAAFEAASAAFRFGPGQIVAPRVLFLAGDLGVDEAVDGLVGDDRLLALPREAAGHLLG